MPTAGIQSGRLRPLTYADNVRSQIDLMPKIPQLSGRKIISILEAHGYQRKRQRGSHVVMRKGSSVCVVPDHKEVKTGTLAGILMQARIAPEEFLAWLQNH